MRGSTPLSRSKYSGGLGLVGNSRLKKIKMKKIKVTMQEIYDAMKPSVHKNKKKYTRKTKHKNNGEEKNYK